VGTRTATNPLALAGGKQHLGPHTPHSPLPYAGLASANRAPRIDLGLETKLVHRRPRVCHLEYVATSHIHASNYRSAKFAATTGVTSHTATESRSFPIQDMLTSSMPSLFRNGETSPPGQNTQSWQDMASWQALAEILTPKALASPSPALRNAPLSTRWWLKPPIIQHAAIYSTSIMFMRYVDYVSGGRDFRSKSL